MTTQPDIEIINLRKTFGDFKAVDGISLSVEPGEFISILGPSGCGKSTTLSMIVGFQKPTDGTIKIKGIDQAGVEPEHRNIGMVFQNYALFPHMTVAENVAFGLKMRGVEPAVINDRVAQALKSVHLEGFAERHPKALSGGQQQRAALARAIAPKSSLLLLDEPLSNLDLKLREAMRLELKALHRSLGMTFVYVTHDQEEALTMSDRIVVMDKGKISQVGTPTEIYQHPANAFVADFIGKSSIIDVEPMGEKDGLRIFKLTGSNHVFFAEPSATADHSAGRKICVRPEKFIVEPKSAANGSGVNTFDAMISEIVNLGSHVELILEIGGSESIVSTISTETMAEIGEDRSVSVSVAPEHVTVLPQ